MGKFMKICGIIALFLLGAGIALTAAGCSISDADKISETVKDVTDGKMNLDLHFLDEKIGEASYSVDDYSTTFSKDHEILSGDIEKTAFTEEIAKLEIHVGGCEMQIQPSDDDKFWLEAKDTSKFQTYVENNTLIINSVKSNSGKNSVQNTVITLYIPEVTVFDAIQAEMGAGQLKADTLKTKEVKLSVGAGRIVVQNLEAQTADVNVGVGDLTLEKIAVKDITGEVGMGNFTVNGKIDGNISFKCAMGNLNAKLTNPSEDFNYILACAMGNINLNGENYSGLAKEKKIDHGSEKTMNLECSMGNIDVEFED